jgi:hypothetical protein
LGKAKLLALFDGEEIYRIHNLEGVLEDLRADIELRREVIEIQKEYLLIDNAMKRLVKKGYLEVVEKPKRNNDLDLAIRRFAKILAREFPEDWRQIKVEWKMKGEKH